MLYVLYTIHILVSIFLILVVLLQQGKGADLSVFGGGATQAAFGARGAATLLHKLTVVAFIAFIFTTVSIALLKSGASQSSVMRGAAVEEGAPAPEPPATPPLEGDSVPPPAGSDDAAPEAAGDTPPDGESAEEGEPPAVEEDGGSSG